MFQNLYTRNQVEPAFNGLGKRGDAAEVALEAAAYRAARRRRRKIAAVALAARALADLAARKPDAVEAEELARQDLR